MMSTLAEDNAFAELQSAILSFNLILGKFFISKWHTAKDISQSELKNTRIEESTVLWKIYNEIEPSLLKKTNH